MASCPRIVSCPLFARFRMKSSLKVWQAHYCEGDFGRCERWRLIDANKPVPAGLLPNGRTLEVPIEQLGPEHMS